MAGNRAGGLKAREKHLASDPMYYQHLGAKGGAAHNKGGFKSSGLAGSAGAKGGKNRTGIRKCHACLTWTRDNVNGFCAACQSQDTPELRALLNMDSKRKKPSVTKANSATSRSTTKQTKPGAKRSEQYDSELSKLAGEWLNDKQAKARIPLISDVADRFHVWQFNRWWKGHMQDEEL